MIHTTLWICCASNLIWSKTTSFSFINISIEYYLSGKSLKQKASAVSNSDRWPAPITTTTTTINPPIENPDGNQNPLLLPTLIIFHPTYPIPNPHLTLINKSNTELAISTKSRRRSSISFLNPKQDISLPTSRNSR